MKEQKTFSSKMRQSVTFSTVTSATGLLTIEAEPNKARSVGHWKPRESKDHMVDGDVGEEEDDPQWELLDRWDFPIFKVANNYPNTLLSRMAFKIFTEMDLISIFKIPTQKLMAFFHSLELGYWDIPYHNRVHAADVLHACFYFTSRRIDASVVNCVKASPVETMPLSQCLSPLELMALYTAAAMHDYDHPGTTNAFLVSVGDQKAILYNDRSVLENHHAAQAWRLLCQKTNFFIDQLDSAEFKRFRYLIIELILATDLKRHFEVISDLNSQAKSEDGLDLYENEQHKLLLCQILLKMADINSPTKPHSLHMEWTNRIISEFYLQGDEEKKRGLPVSPYMDRNEPQVPKLQDSFIAHLVNPLVHAINDISLFPVAPPSSGGKMEILANLTENHKYWQQQLGSPDQPQMIKDDSTLMVTIHEREEDENESIN